MKKALGMLVLNYLRFFAKIQLLKNGQATIIGITGTHGKSSTRLALAKILKGNSTVKHSAHANSESGIPLNILGLETTSYTVFDWARLMLLAPLQILLNWEKYDYYIVEMGIDSPDSPKNMDYLLSIIQPDLAIVLNAGLVHGVYFDHLAKANNSEARAKEITRLIAKEKMKLASSIASSGHVILGDQKELLDLQSKVKAHVHLFGTSKDSELKIDKVEVAPKFKFDFHYHESKYSFVAANYFEPAYAKTFSAAILAAAQLGVDPQDTLNLLHDFHPPSGRLTVFRGLKGSHLIDSSYNASPDTMRSALELLKALGKGSRKIAVIGEMRELGEVTEREHRLIATHIKHSADECLLFGNSTLKYTYPELQKANFPVRHFTKMEELISYLQASAKSGDWILFDGSQNTILLERAVEAMLENHAQDNSRLARRGEFWDEMRRNTD